MNDTNKKAHQIRIGENEMYVNQNRRRRRRRYKIGAFKARSIVKYCKWNDWMRCFVVVIVVVVWVRHECNTHNTFDNIISIVLRERLLIETIYWANLCRTFSHKLQAHFVQ